MDTTAFGDPMGQIPRMDTFDFKCDEKLVETAKAVSYTHLDVYKRQIQCSTSTTHIRR